MFKNKNVLQYIFSFNLIVIKLFINASKSKTLAFGAMYK